MRGSIELLLLAGFLLTNVGCGGASRAELEQARAELAAARDELAALQAVRQLDYLDALERLDALRAKGVLTQEEFEAKKKAALAAPRRPTQPASPMEELAKQLRLVQSLYMNNTINSTERDQKKRQLLSGPIALVDLKNDLETVAELYNENTIGSTERDALKKRLLEAEPARR